MMRIKIDRQEVTLDGSNFTLERYCPLLDINVIRGARVMPFKITRNGVSDRLFGFQGNRQVKVSNIIRPATIDMGGDIIERGFFKMNSVGDGYEGVFTSWYGGLFDPYTDLSLQELNLGSEAVNQITNPVIGTAKVCWPMIKNTGFYGQNGYGGYMNNYSGSYSGNPKVPMLFMHRVYELLGNLCGVSFDGDFFDDTTTEKIIIINTVDVSGKATLKYNEHLPDMTVREFLVETAKLLNLVYWIDPVNRKIRVDFADDWFKADGRGIHIRMKDWSRKFGEIRTREPLVKNWLRVMCDVDSNDGTVKSVPDGFKPIIKHGTGQEDLRNDYLDIKTKWSGVLMDGNFAKIDMEGVTESYNQTGKKFGARVAFWNGMVSSVPKASNEYSGKYLRFGADPNPDHNNVLNGYYLNMFWFLLRTWKVDVSCKLTSYELSELDMHRKKGGFTRVYVQGNYYLIGNQRIQKNGIWSGELWRL